MIMTRLLLAAAAAATLVAGAATSAELTIPSLIYRTGPYAPGGIQIANGYADYFALLNERDGGIEGARINLVECETGYNTRQGVECYENTKNLGSGALVYQPNSTGIAYQLIPKATEDRVTVFSMGYGRTSAADGTVFPWVFNFPATYWSQATALVQYIADREGGMDRLRGRTIAHVYHNSAYGKEPIRTLEVLAERFGFELMLLPIDHPGQEQKATWLQIRRDRPDWILLWGWGVMNQVAIREAASIRFPMDRFIGNWWTASENDVLPAGAAADGYLAGTFHAPGDDFPVLDDIRERLYAAGKGAGEAERVGETLYNRGIIAAMWTAEAIRGAMRMHGTDDPTPAQVRDGFEALDVDEDRLAELGLPGFTYAVKITCANHEGPGRVAVQQWDATARKWTLVSGFYEPLREITAPLVAADAAAYAAEHGITPRDCG